MKFLDLVGYILVILNLYSGLHGIIQPFNILVGGFLLGVMFSYK